MCLCLHAKFQVSSIILTGFRQRDNLSPPQNEPLKKSPPRLGLSTSEAKRKSKVCWKELKNFAGKSVPAKHLIENVSYNFTLKLFPAAPSHFVEEKFWKHTLLQKGSLLEIMIN